MSITKKIAVFVAGILAMTVITGCATAIPFGCLYTDVTLPAALGNGELTYSKEASAKCTSLLGLIAVGNASLNAAANAGAITTISWASYKVINVLGTYGMYKVTVYGE